MTITAEQLELLAVGSKAPNFDLPAHDGTQITLGDYAGKNLVIVFYPKDSTPGCTRQLCALRDDRETFKGLNTEVLASNPGSANSHTNFVEKQQYNFPILVDAEREMAASYHTLKENGTSIERTVYIIDGEGVIRYAKRGLPSDEELIEAINNF